VARAVIVLDWHEELIKLRRIEFEEEHGETPEEYCELKRKNHNLTLETEEDILVSYLIKEDEVSNGL
jgi:hypothetical protein